MAKELCKLKKELHDDFSSFVRLVREAKFVCHKCGRSAKKKKFLCTPKKIKGAA